VLTYFPGICRDRRLSRLGGKPLAVVFIALTLAAFLLAPTAALAAPDTPAKSSPKPKSKPPKELKRTDIDVSMVGYIDDSSIRSQVRVRFDAGFNDPRPDRAEYFYAGENSTPPGGSPLQRSLNFQQLYFSGEYAPVKRFSVFTLIPYRWIQPTFFSAVGPGSPNAPCTGSCGAVSSGGGISDVQAGIKVGLIASDTRQLTFQFRSYFPSGDGARGFGTNHYSIEPMLLYYQHLSERVSLESEFGDTHPIGGTIYTSDSVPAVQQNFAGDVLMYGVGPSYRLIDRDSFHFTPVLELVAWHVFGGLQTGNENVVQSADDINVFNMKLGARASFGHGNSIYAGYGRALTSDIWYRNLFRIEYRHAF
jgi:hypothetical protein